MELERKFEARLYAKELELQAMGNSGSIMLVKLLSKRKRLICSIYQFSNCNYSHHKPEIIKFRGRKRCTPSALASQSELAPGTTGLRKFILASG